MSILLNNTANNSCIVDIFINSLTNLNYNYNVTKTYELNLYTDSSNNQWIEGIMIVVENGVSTTYTKKQPFNYSSGIINDNNIIQNFSYIMNYLSLPIDRITIHYNSVNYICDHHFVINSNKYYILTPV